MSFNQYEFSDRKLSWQRKNEGIKEVLCEIGFVILIGIVWFGLSLLAI
jgi:hypothetical protein